MRVVTNVGENSCLRADLPQTAAGVRAADGEGGGHDLRQLEGAHHVQHQAAQVNTHRICVRQSRLDLIQVPISATASTVTLSF